MNLKNQRRLAAKILNVGVNRVWFDQNRSQEIKEAITRNDLSSLIKDRAIQAKPKKGISRGRARKIKVQKRKGRRKGIGSRKGKETARLPGKKEWMNKIRVQRSFLKVLKEKKYIGNNTYRILYRRSKGGFFRSKRHIKLYLEERNLIKKKK